MPQRRSHATFWQSPDGRSTPSEWDEKLAALYADPAFSEIATAAMRARDFGIDLTQPENLDRVVAVGRRDYERRRAAEPTTTEKLPRDRVGSFGSRFRHLPITYYMLLGSLVKIGTSTNIANRVDSFNPERILGVEFGGREVERSRHKQFSDLHHHGEWFTDGEVLRNHIRSLRADFEQRAECTVEEWLKVHLSTSRFGDIGLDA